MPAHSLAPGFVEIHYTYSQLLHKMRLPVIPDASWAVGVEPSLVQKNGVSVDFSTAIDAFVTLLRPLFANTTEIIKADAWFYPVNAPDPIWVYSHPIGLLGTGVTANLLAGQMVISFRTILGGIMKLYLMEGSYTTNARNSYPFGAGNLTNLTNYMIGVTSWIYGRDNGALIVPMWATTKANDALRKIRLNM